MDEEREVEDNMEQVEGEDGWMKRGRDRAPPRSMQCYVNTNSSVSIMKLKFTLPKEDMKRRAYHSTQ